MRTPAPVITRRGRLERDCGFEGCEVGGGVGVGAESCHDLRARGAWPRGGGEGGWFFFFFFCS